MNSFPKSTDAAFEALRWDTEPRFYKPDYTRSIVGVLPTVFEMLEQPVEQDEEAGRRSLRRLLPNEVPKKASHVLVLCIDGLGFKELASSPLLSRLWESYGTWITSVFPSITSAALTSIYQSLPPARHGLTGHQIWKDEVGAVIDMLRMQVLGAQMPLLSAGVDVTRFEREPGLLDQPVARALPSLQLMPQHIVGSGLSHYAYGATPLAGYGHPIEGFTKVCRFYEHHPRGWVSLYISTIDSLGHALGGTSSQVTLALRHIEEMLVWLFETLQRHGLNDTVVVLATDHGQSDIEDWVPFYGDHRNWLEKAGHTLGFSGRVMHVYGCGGRPRLTDTRDRLTDLVGSLGRVLSFDQVRELLGPPGRTDDDWLRASLGDLVVILHEGINWQKRHPQAPHQPFASGLVSQHGALSWNEVIVPFFAAPLSEVARLDQAVTLVG